MRRFSNECIYYLSLGAWTGKQFCSAVIFKRGVSSENSFSRWLVVRATRSAWMTSAIFHCDPDAKEFVLNRRRISPFYLLLLLRKYNINFPAYYLCFLSSFAILSSITNYLRTFYCLAYWIHRSIDSHCNWIWW